MLEFKDLEALREAVRRAVSEAGMGAGAHRVEGFQNINIDLDERIKVFNPKDDNVGGAAAIDDPDAFVRLVQDLLMIFPNGERAVEVLDPSSALVTPDDLLVVSIVVPALRAMLAKTPREQRRRKIRKAQVALDAAKQELVGIVKKLGVKFTNLVNAMS